MYESQPNQYPVHSPAPLQERLQDMAKEFPRLAMDMALIGEALNDGQIAADVAEGYMNHYFFQYVLERGRQKTAIRVPGRIIRESIDN